MKALSEVKIFGPFAKYFKKRMPASSGAGIKATKEEAEEPIVESAGGMASTYHYPRPLARVTA